MMKKLRDLLHSIFPQPSRRRKAEMMTKSLEEVGFSSQWNEAEQTVTLTHPDGTVLQFYFGEDQIDEVDN